MWQYEPPASAPVSKTVEIEFGFPKECPGPVSEMGEVEGNERLFDKNGKLVAVADEEDYQLPNYAEAERKAGIAATMILSITLDANGRVKEIHAASHCRQAWIELPLIWCGRGGLDGWTGSGCILERFAAHVYFPRYLPPSVGPTEISIGVQNC